MTYLPLLFTSPNYKTYREPGTFKSYQHCESFCRSFSLHNPIVLTYAKRATTSIILVMLVSSQDSNPLPISQPSQTQTNQNDMNYHKELQENIFERSLSTSPFQSFNTSRRNSKVANSIRRTGRSMSVTSTGSVCSLNLIPAHYSTEDFVAPVLDTTAEILTDPRIDYDDITVVSCECDDSACRSKHLPKGKGQKSSQRPRPILRSRSKSRSFICTSLMEAFDHGELLEGTECEKESGVTPPLSPQDGITINFYSFADVVNGEHDLEKFNSQPMSEYLA